MYDPTVGRWLSLDPIGFEGNDTNLYRYVGNEPITSIDYWGLAKRNLKDIHAEVVFEPKSVYTLEMAWLADQAFERIKNAYEILLDNEKFVSCCIKKYYSMTSVDKAYRYLVEQIYNIILNTKQIRIEISDKPHEKNPDAYASVDKDNPIPKRTIIIYPAFFNGYDIINGEKTARSEKTQIDTFIHEFHHYALKKTDDYFTYEHKYKDTGYMINGAHIYPKDKFIKVMEDEAWEKRREFPVEYQYENAYTFERFINCLLGED